MTYENFLTKIGVGADLPPIEDTEPEDRAWILKIWLAKNAKSPPKGAQNGVAADD